MRDEELALRYGVAFAAPLAVTLLLTPAAGRLARRLGVLDEPGARKFHVTATPYLGGVAVAGGLVLVSVVTRGLTSQLVTILLCSVVLLGMGLRDDWNGVSPAVKLIVETAAGLALWLSGARAGLFGVYGLDVVVTVLWVVVVTNALNLIDNMDGLASGVAALSATGLFVIAADQGHFLVGSLALAVAGASLGFLIHNFPPAKIFLGDAGSLPLGFLLAALALDLDLVGESGVARTVIPVLAVSVPLFDMTLVVVARLRERSPIYRGGTDHSSHRLVALGLSPRQVALVAFAAQAVSSALAVVVYRTSDAAALVALGAGVAAAVAALTALLHVDPGLASLSGRPARTRTEAA